jgi:ribosomal protein L11 methylase PrmA
MNGISPIPGSFRDPSGRVYQLDGRILRTVNECFAKDFEIVQETGLLNNLASQGLILPIQILSSDILSQIGVKAAYVIETPKLPFITFPYEWPFSALKAAALLHLQIHLQALKVGVTLSDASAYNIQFRGAQPVFIDHLSFRPYRTGEVWVGHRQFCEQFLNPLLLRAFFGLSHNALYRGTQEGITASDMRSLIKWRHFWNKNVLTHVVLQNFLQKTAASPTKTVQGGKSPTVLFPLSSFTHLLKKLHSWIAKLEPKKMGKSIWGDYPRNCSYSLNDSKFKTDFILEFARTVRPNLLFDFGCNTGEYAKAAIEGGAQYVVGFDFDQGALETSFKKAAKSQLPIQAVFMDVANPSPNQGWNNQEREGLQVRAKGDALLALALIHHLVIARNIPLDEVVNWLISLAPQGVIEFVPKQDPMVQQMLSFREDIFSDYTYENFIARLSEKTVVIKAKPILNSSRVLVWFKRK